MFLWMQFHVNVLFKSLWWIPIYVFLFVCFIWFYMYFIPSACFLSFNCFCLSSTHCPLYTARSPPCRTLHVSSCCENKKSRCKRLAPCQSPGPTGFSLSQRLMLSESGRGWHHTAVMERYSYQSPHACISAQGF